MKKNMNRRNVLKLGSTAPVWVTPIISSIVLPAHAQTSLANLVDVTPPPPGFVFCAAQPTSSLPNVVVQVQNAGASSVAITAINVTVDIGSSSWTADTALPTTLEANETLSIEFSSSPEFVCTSTQNPRLSTVYETNMGSVTLVHSFG